MSFGYELISETDSLQEFTELGRIVPEYRNDKLREIIIRPYRIVYRLNHEEKLCEIAREESRGCKSKPPGFSGGGTCTIVKSRIPQRSSRDEELS
jgi:ParE toxin of type II toxin-antitoxin system, parDE